MTKLEISYGRIVTRTGPTQWVLYVFHPGRSHRSSLLCIFHGKIGFRFHPGGRSMLINLHSQATTTPKTLAEIQASDEPARVLARRYGITEQTVWK